MLVSSNGLGKEGHAWKGGMHGDMCSWSMHTLTLILRIILDLPLI